MGKGKYPSPFSYHHFKHWVGKHGTSSGIGGGAWNYTLVDYAKNQGIDYNKLAQHAYRRKWRMKIENSTTKRASRKAVATQLMKRA
jgi:hypothetical protein